MCSFNGMATTFNRIQNAPPKTGLKSELLGEKQNKTHKHLTPADVKTNELLTIQPKND